MQSLVSHAVEAGFPAAVAMIAPVAAVDAHEFTRAFYRGLFDQLRTTAAALVHQPRVPFEWLQSLHFARTAICDLHGGNAANAPQWSIPVLYVRGIDPPQFMEPPPAGQQDRLAEFMVRTRLTADFLEASRGTMSEERRLAMMSEILTDVPKSYWPNVDGRFDQA
jgi:hypothetical protein